MCDKEPDLVFTGIYQQLNLKFENNESSTINLMWFDDSQSNCMILQNCVREIIAHQKHLTPCIIYIPRFLKTESLPFLENLKSIKPKECAKILISSFFNPKADDPDLAKIKFILCFLNKAYNCVPNAERLLKYSLGLSLIPCFDIISQQVFSSFDQSKVNVMRSEQISNFETNSKLLVVMT